MNKVRIFNENDYPLDETFKGEELHIEAHDYWRDKKGEIKVMDVFEASDYTHQYKPIPVDTDGKMVRDQKYWKKVRVEPIGEIVKMPEPSGFKCMATGCKHVSASPEELETHGKVRHPNAEALILPEEDAVIEHKKQAGRAKG